MAKFIKSIFHPTERRKSRFEDDEERNYTPPDIRRKLSISRSGRMKQANKKRHSLCPELYNKELESVAITVPSNGKTDKAKETKKEETVKRRHSTDIQADDEIDSAFEIIEKP